MQEKSCKKEKRAYKEVLLPVPKGRICRERHWLERSEQKKSPPENRRAGSAERTQILRMMPMGVDSLDWPRGLSPRILAIWSMEGSFSEKPRMLAPRSLMSTMATG